MAPVEEGTSTKVELVLTLLGVTAVLVFTSVMALS